MPGSVWASHARQLLRYQKSPILVAEDESTTCVMDTRECPGCAMEVDADAEVCPICGYEFPRQSKSVQIMAVVMVILLLLWYLF